MNWISRLGLKVPLTKLFNSLQGTTSFLRSYEVIPTLPIMEISDCAKLKNALPLNFKNIATNPVCYTTKCLQLKR